MPLIMIYVSDEDFDLLQEEALADRPDLAELRPGDTPDTVEHRLKDHVASLAESFVSEGVCAIRRGRPVTPPEQQLNLATSESPHPDQSRPICDYDGCSRTEDCGPFCRRRN